MGLSSTQKRALLCYALTTLGQIIALSCTVNTLSSGRALLLHAKKETATFDDDQIRSDDDQEDQLQFDKTCAIILVDYKNHKVDGQDYYDFGGKTVKELNVAGTWYVDPAISGCKTSTMAQDNGGSLHGMWVFAIM